MPKYTNEKNVSSSHYAVVTPSDTVNFTIEQEAKHCRAVYVGGAGIVQAVRPDNTVVAFTCVAGGILPIVAKRINTTSTTATLIVALF